MAKKPFKLSIRTILTILTFILVGYVVYQNWPDIVQSFYDLSKTNIFILLLLIPEQFCMYYACGKIFYSYLQNRYKVKVNRKEIFRTARELNFITHAVPGGGVGALGFLTFKLHRHDITAGQTSFLYMFRYAITTVINYIQALIAIIILAALNLIPESATWILWLAVLMNVGVFCLYSTVVFIASGKKRIDTFSHFVVNAANFCVKIFTFGRKKQVLKFETIHHYLIDIHESVMMAKSNLKSLAKPALWGLVFSIFEVATYWVVAISLGRPELLPFILVGEAIGSVFDGIVPYGLYELGMAGVMIALGVDFSTATIITVMTRVATLLITICSGLLPYRQTMMKLGKEDERNDA